MLRQLLHNLSTLTPLCLVAVMSTATAAFVYSAKSMAADAVAGPQGEAKSPAVDAESVLFQKALDGKRELTVVRGWRHSMVDVAPPVMSKSAFQQLNIPERGYFTLFLQVRPAEGPPLTLASRLICEWSDAPASGGLDVLDVLVDNGLFVVAIGSTGIELWRVMPYGDPKQRKAPSETWTVLNGWSGIALASYVDRKSVRLRLSLTKDGRVQADVDDLRANLRTHFLQVGDKWEFNIAPKQ